MTSPETNVGSIIARVGLDTSGLKQSEADSAASLRRTATNLDNTAKAADKVQKNIGQASTAIKRNADVQVESIRRSRQAANQAERERAASRSGSMQGSVAGLLAGQLISNGIGALGDGQGGTRDHLATILGATMTGGGIGAVAGPAGAAIGGFAGGAIALGTITTASIRRADAAARAADAHRDEAAAQAAVNDQLRRGKEFTDDLGRAQLRLADAWARVNATQAALTDPNARSREAGIVAPLLGGMFDEHQRMTQGDVGRAADRLIAAQERVQRAQDRLDRVRDRSGGASRSSLLSAEASVRSAQDRLASGRGDHQTNLLRLQAAEERLADLRKKGGGSTRELAAAERDLASARRKADEAQAAATKAGLPAALDPLTLLRRQAAKQSDVTQLDRDARALARKGLRAPVIEELLQTEKDAPGTVHRVATTITRAQIAAFNAQQQRIQKAADDLVRVPLQRAADDAKADAAKNAAAVAAATRAAYAAAFSGGAVSPNLGGASGLLSGTTGDPLYTGMFTTGSAPRSFRPKGASRRDADYAVPSVTFTGPVTINDGTKHGVLADTQRRVNALSRP